MLSDVEFTLWLRERRDDDDAAALRAAVHELQEVVAAAYGSARPAQVASGRIRRIEQALAALRE